MKRCQMMVDVGRRKFLSGARMAAAGVAAATVAMPQAKAAPASARVNYPVQPAGERQRSQGERAA